MTSSVTISDLLVQLISHTNYIKEYQNLIVKSISSDIKNTFVHIFIVHFMLLSVG